MDDEKKTPKVEVVITFGSSWLLGLIVVLLFLIACIGLVVIERMA